MLTTDRASESYFRTTESRGASSGQLRPPRTYGMSDTWDLIRRHWRLLAFLLAVGGATSVIVAASLTPVYTATSAIVFDRNDTRPYEAVVEARQQERDRSTMETELDVIRSRLFMGIVVDALKLTKDPFYNTYLTKAGTVSDKKSRSWLEWMKGKVLGSGPAVQLTIPDRAQRDRAISRLLSTFTVDRKGDSLALSIRVDQIKPKRAAVVANAIAEHYVAWTSSLKEVATKKTVKYLRGQADDLAISIANKEREIAVFTTKSDLTFDPKDDLLRARLVQLNEQFTLARVEEASAWAKVNESRQRRAANGEADVGKVFSSDLLTSLRTEGARLQRLHGQLTSKFGSNHPLVMDAEAELASNRSMISDEATRIMQELENVAEIATIRVKKFRDEVSLLQDRIRSRNLAEIRRRELERDLLSEQKRYDTVVLRLGILNPEEEEVKATAMVSSFAEVPVEPSFPQPIFILIAGLVGSALIALIAIIISDALDDRLYKPWEVEEVTHRPNIINIPNFRRSRQTTFELYRTMLRNPDSLFSRAMRTLCLAWRTIDGSPDGKVVMLCSVSPGEGRTTLALSMAITAKANGLRTVVVDLAPSSASAGAIAGLMHWQERGEVLSIQQDNLDCLIRVSPIRPFLDMIVSTLALRDYERLFTMLRRKYDLVIVDTMATSVSEDAIWLSSHVDSILMVARAGKTRERALLEAVQRLDFNSALLIGSIMNFYGRAPLRYDLRHGVLGRLWRKKVFA